MIADLNASRSATIRPVRGLEVGEDLRAGVLGRTLGFKGEVDAGDITTIAEPIGFERPRLDLLILDTEFRSILSF